MVGMDQNLVLWAPNTRFSDNVFCHSGWAGNLAGAGTGGLWLRLLRSLGSPCQTSLRAKPRRSSDLPEYHHMHNCTKTYESSLCLFLPLLFIRQGFQTESLFASQRLQYDHTPITTHIGCETCPLTTCAFRARSLSSIQQPTHSLHRRIFRRP